MPFAVLTGNNISSNLRPNRRRFLTHVNLRLPNLFASTASSPWVIVKSGGQTIEEDWLTVYDSTGNPANTWYYGANGSADTWSLAHGWASVPAGGGGFPDSSGMGVMTTGKYWW